jgi:hypothetical protein
VDIHFSHPFFLFSLLFLPAELYPKSEGAAQDAVDMFHAQQLSQGVKVTVDAPWNMEDLAITCHARLKPIDDFLIRLIASLREIFQALWPTSLLPRRWVI